MYDGSSDEVGRDDTVAAVKADFPFSAVLHLCSSDELEMETNTMQPAPPQSIWIAFREFDELRAFVHSVRQGQKQITAAT